MPEHQQYSETFQMKYGEGDLFGRVRPAILMRYVEDVSLKHATLLGVSREFNESHNMVFLLAKQAIAFVRMPRSNETLTFVTQPEQSKRVTFRRVTVIYDAAGQEVACVDSIWVLVDLTTNRLLRRSPVPFDAQWAPQIARSVAMRTQKAEHLQERGVLCASYAHCDENRHINNATYFDIVCDLLSVDRMQATPPKRIVVNYHREVRLGEQICLCTGENDTGVYIVGTKEGICAFEAACDF